MKCKRTLADLQQQIMAAVFGSISEFVFESEDITEWVERLEQWFVANGLEGNEDRKKALLLSNVGARGYKLIRSLAQNKPTKKSYDELKTLMVEHLNPKPNEIAQRYVFYKRDRRNGETVKDYVAALRKLSEHCNFAEKLEDHLRDRFVCGLNDEKVQQKLLATQKLTLKTAVDNAVAMEAAVRSAKQIHGLGVEVSSIHKFSSGGHPGFQNKYGGKGRNRKNLSKGNNSSQNSSSKSECFRCGSYAHFADKCPFKDRECYGCRKIGHSKSKCRTRSVNYEGVLENEDNENELEEEIYTLNLYRLDVIEESDEESDDQFELVEEMQEAVPICEKIDLHDPEIQGEVIEVIKMEEILIENEVATAIGREIEMVAVLENDFEVELSVEVEDINQVDPESVLIREEITSVEEFLDEKEKAFHEKRDEKEIVAVEPKDKEVNVEIEEYRNIDVGGSLSEVFLKEEQRELQNLHEAEITGYDDDFIVNANKLGEEEIRKSDPFMVSMKLNDIKTNMELDTGAGATVISSDL